MILPAANIWPDDFAREDFLTAFKALMETQKDLVMHDAKFLAIKKDNTKVTNFDLTYAGRKKCRRQAVLQQVHNTLAPNFGACCAGILKGTRFSE